MPLDPEIANILKAVESMPPMEGMTLDALRASIQYPPLERRTPVGESRDIDIDLGTRVLASRLYLPEHRRVDGLLVFFHGGGWVIGNLETHDHVCRDLCTHGGFAVLAVDYRLAPEHPFPAAVEDCRDVLRWAAKQGEQLRSDVSRMVVAGDSAGANLAAVSTLCLRDGGGPALRAQVLLYPVTDYHTPPTRSYLDNAAGYSLTRPAMVRFWRDYLDSEEQARHPHASVLRADSLSELPPALVVTAEFDPLRDEGEAYAHRLLDAGVPVTLWREAGLIHGFMRMAMASKKSMAVLVRTTAWIREALT